MTTARTSLPTGAWVLDTLLGLRTQFESKVQFLHSEIYTDGSGKSQNPQNAPAVLAYHLPGEPVRPAGGRPVETAADAPPPEEQGPPVPARAGLRVLAPERVTVPAGLMNHVPSSKSSSA